MESGSKWPLQSLAAWMQLPILQKICTSMDAAKKSAVEKKARKAVNEHLRRYFERLKADLEDDAESFFHRVMQQADRSPNASRR